MAHKLTDYTLPQGGSKYNWDEWLDGSPWLLERGVDYTTTDTTMRTMVYSAAKARGVRARTRTHEQGLVIVASVPT